MPLVSATDIPYQPFPTGRTPPQAPSDYQQIPTEPSEFGALQGQALEKFGAGVEKLAGSVANVAAYQQHVFTRNAVDKGRMQFDDAIYRADYGIDPATGQKVEKGFLDLRGDEAIQKGVPKQVLDDARDSIAASMPNEEARSLFLRQSRASRQAADLKYAAHYSQQLEKASQDTGHAQILQGARDAGIAADDDAFETAINGGRAGALKQPDPKSASIISDDHITGSYIAGQIAKGNWAEAQRVLDKYGNLLTGDRQESYANALRAHTKRASLRGDAAEALGDVPAPSGGGGPGPATKPYTAGEILTGTGASQATYDKFRGRMSKEESGGQYNIAPNKEGYMGKYQMNMKDIRESSARLGIQVPTQQEFLKNEDLQERLFETYEATGHDEMMRNPIYANASPEQKLALLAAWHLTGGPNLNNYLATGKEYADSNGTRPSDYIKRFSQTLDIKPPLYGTVTGPAPVAGTRVAAGPATTVTDATAPADTSGGPILGPSGQTTAQLAASVQPGGQPASGTPPSAAPVPAPAAPTVAAQAGPKPMPSLQEALRKAGEIADRKGYDDETRHNLLTTTQSEYNLRRAKVEEDRKRLTDGLYNGKALLADGRPFAYDEATIRHLMPPDEADKQIDELHDAEDAGAAHVAVSRLSPSETVQWQDAVSKEVERNPNSTGAARRLRYLAHFNEEIRKRDNDLRGEHADPATYLIQRDQKVPPDPSGPTSIAALHNAAFPENGPMNPAAFDAYATATLAEQARLGVLPEKQSVLPKSQAAAQAQYFAKTDPGTADIGAQLGQMQKQYGRYWDKAYGDMVKAGLPQETRVIAQMSQPEQAVGRQDYQEMLKIVSTKGGMERFKKENFDGKDVTDIEHEVRTSLDQFRKSSPVGAGLSEDMQSAAVTLALYYKYHGDSVNTAADKAYKAMVGNKYDFTGSGNQLMRVPKGQSGLMESAGDALQHHIKPDDLANNIPAAPGVRPETAQANMLDAIRNGYWQNNEGDDGAVLYLRARNGWHDIARLKSGERIEFKWNDARRLSQFAPPLAPYVPEGGEMAPPSRRGFEPMGYRALMLGGPPT